MALIGTSYDAAPERIWELWTTAEGIEQWWAPGGFSVVVQELDVRPGGRLVYTMTARAPQMVACMEENGMPLETRSQKQFTEVDEPRRLAYTSLIDFVPGVEPYEHLTTVDLEATATGTHVAISMGPLHDDEWTQRLVAGRMNELEN